MLANREIKLQEYSDTFDNFVIGRSNRLAFTAALEAASLEKERGPLLLCGGSGKVAFSSCRYIRISAKVDLVKDLPPQPLPEFNHIGVHQLRIPPNTRCGNAAAALP